MWERVVFLSTTTRIVDDLGGVACVPRVSSPLLFPLSLMLSVNFIVL